MPNRELGAGGLGAAVPSLLISGENSLEAIKWFTLGTFGEIEERGSPFPPEWTVAGGNNGSLG